MFCRNMPFRDPQEIEELLTESVTKELKAAQEEHSVESLDWQAILSQNRVYRSNNSLISNTTFDGELNNRIFSRLSSAKSKISCMTIYPDYSRKTIGRRGQSDMRLINEALREDFPPTPAGLEQLYHRYGISLDSPTEVRTSFKFHDIRPRVYYARGPAQYHASKYIQEIFNVLVDAFPTTGRYQRFLVTSIRLSIEDMLFIYDFSSFTSTLNEIRRFTDGLIDFFEGVDTAIIDSRVGLCRISVSELLREYQETCNRNPHFDVSDIFGTGAEEDLVHNCGMLGVPGNISSCTLLHGLFLMTVLMSETCRVVGDDAIGSGPAGSKKEIIRLLRIIGIVAAEKMETWEPRDFGETPPEDSRWHYTKRPIERIDDLILFSDQAVIWPPLGNIHPIFGDSYHTVIYPEDFTDQRQRVGNSMLSFVLQFQEYHLEEDEAKLADRFIDLVYRATGVKEQHEDGTVSWYASGVLAHSVYEGMSPALIVERLWNTAITLPLFERIYDVEWDYCENIRMNGSRALKLARDLGYAQIEPVFYTFIVGSNPEYLETFIAREHRFPVVEVSFVKHTPSFLVELMFPPCPSQVTDYDTSLLSSDSEEDV